MLVSQKSKYALRAIFELARQFDRGNGTVKISEIARSQFIPIKFLEVILSQLKQGGFVYSKRGKDGGYSLSLPPNKITIGDILNFIQGPINPADCLSKENSKSENCPLIENCVFLPLWEKIKKALSEIYENTTFEDLLEIERKKGEKKYVPNYCI